MHLPPPTPPRPAVLSGGEEGTAQELCHLRGRSGQGSMGLHAPWLPPFWWGGGGDRRKGQRNWQRASGLNLGPQSRLDLRLGEGPEGPRETLLQGQDWGSVLNQMWQIQARSRHTISTGLGAGQGLAYDPGWGAADDLGQDSVWVVPRFDVGLESGIR